jgi:hypothetical protein
MQSRHWIVVACVPFVLASAACGPGDLPAFANPPPEPDSGLVKDASADEDAGGTDAGTRERDAADDEAE